MISPLCAAYLDPCLAWVVLQVRLNVSRGLGLSLQITGNDVRVKGFSPIQGGDDGPAQACGQIQVSGSTYQQQRCRVWRHGRGGAGGGRVALREIGLIHTAPVFF